MRGIEVGRRAGLMALTLAALAVTQPILAQADREIDQRRQERERTMRQIEEREQERREDERRREERDRRR